MLGPRVAQFVRRQLTRTRVALQDPAIFRTRRRLLARRRLLLRGDSSIATVALTFDDGPNSVFTPIILDFLHEAGIRATFFWVGTEIAKFPEIVRRALREGHAVGNHTYSHPDLAKIPRHAVDREIASTSELLEQITGERTTLFRPPYGSVRSRVLRQVDERGLICVGWSACGLDWDQANAQQIAQRILADAGNGAVFLLHDGGGDRSQTIAALPLIVDALRSRGMAFVTIPQMLAGPGDGNQAIAS